MVSERPFEVAVGFGEKKKKKKEDHAAVWFPAAGLKIKLTET